MSNSGYWYSVIFIDDLNQAVTRRHEGETTMSVVTERGIVQPVAEWSEIFVERYPNDIEGRLSFDFMKVNFINTWLIEVVFEG